MMKRLPLFVSFAAVVALSASLAFWFMELVKPPQRALTALVSQAAPEPGPDAVAGLFGGRLQVAALSHYQLKGVVAAGNGRGSVAILASDAKPAQAYPVGAEVAPGVTVKDVQPLFVLLSDGGVPKRVELEQAVVGGGGAAALAPPQPSQQQMTPPPQQQMTPPPAAPPLQMAPPSRVVSPPAGSH
ncbi:MULTISPECIES: type II secretion system protein N [unclassified Janthinobacterium]|uniref:type II secretion system protein N n=1 Tax=unclassified Janthinobacterium TaxID=2610881 RepID=UPI000347FAD1|nr:MULTISPECIES: type II secretion system protein N [unclassified Janthinobacterium]MEC5158963.1 general secretion pathway protein C [Janthinobacterium sp. CG_S6]